VVKSSGAGCQPGPEGANSGSVTPASVCVVYATGKGYTPSMDDAPSEALDLGVDSGMDPAAQPLFARLAELAAAIGAERRRYAATTKPLIEERNRLWHELTALGYSRRDLATVAKVTPMTVQAVVKGRSGRQRRRQGKGKTKGKAGSSASQ
jgi:hypothetical protein